LSINIEFIGLVVIFVAIVVTVLRSR